MEEIQGSSSFAHDAINNNKSDSSPGNSTAANSGTVTPTEGVVNIAKKERGRVRFNSTAARDPPPIISKPSPARTPTTTAANDEVTTPVRKPRPSIIRGSSYNSVLDMADPNEGLSPDKLQSAVAAHQRAQEFAVSGMHGFSGSRRSSVDSETELVENGLLPSDMPLGDMSTPQGEQDEKYVEQTNAQKDSEAYRLVRAHTTANLGSRDTTRLLKVPDQDFDGSYEAQQARENALPQEGVLSNLLKLYRVEMPQQKSGYTTPGSSGTATPTRRKWYDQNQSQDTLASLAAASAILANPNEKRHGVGSSRPNKHKRSHSNMLKSMVGVKRTDEEARITVHISDILGRQKYIIKLCRALMLFGAPTHRLEEYLRMMARVLEIQGQFLYLPGCMIISFDDIATHTTEVKLVRAAQGVNLGKLKDAHQIYKEVLHDVISVQEATDRLDAMLNEVEQRRFLWTRVFMYGVASATVAPFAFNGRWIDLPICFILGCLVGWLQLIVAPMSDVIRPLSEVGSAVLTSFAARAFGSIQYNGADLFCFSAIAQSAIVLILPGYLVLCAALELQSQAIIPGSLRMVYAIIYSLFLGFGITIGTAIWGLIDSSATSSTTCANGLDSRWHFLFVPIFAFCLTYINHAKWKQMPIMISIATIGYVITFYFTLYFPNSSQISNMLGAFSVGFIANLYSRLRHGVAAAALLPAIFVQVPSGLAATGSLVSGLSTANELTNKTTSTSTTSSTTTETDTLIFNVAASMIEIAVGITVGLFLATLIIYPLGKRRSGLFTF